MTKCASAIVMVVSLLLAGCAGDPKPAAAQGQRPRYDFLRQAGWTVEQGGQAAPGRAAAPHQSPGAPQGAPVEVGQFSIALHTFDGGGHESAAKKAKDALTAKGLAQGYLVHRSGQTSLMYGFYATHVRAEQDLAKLTAYSDRPGRRPFADATIVNTDPSDPDAPAEWDLKNAKGYFSLVVASYCESPDRKQYAVDSVKAAREQGVEAYYYHGPTTSDVCIGAWPRTAIKEQDTDVAVTGGLDWQQPILVTDHEMKGLHGPLVDTRTGRAVKVYSPKVEILDPSLKQAMTKYDVLCVNDAVPVYVNPQTGQKTMARSFVCVIPGAEAAHQAGLRGGQPGTAQPGYSNPLPPSILSGQPTQRGGRLRSVND